MDLDATPPASFFATLASPASFAKLCSFLNDLVDSVNLVFTKTGLEITSIDNARVALIQLLLRQGAFVFYDLGGAKRVEIGVKLDTLCSALKNVKLGDTVSMRHSPSSTLDILKTVSRDQGGIAQQIEFKIDAVIIDQDELEIPERTYPCETLLPSSIVSQVCKELKQVGGEIAITVKPDLVTFSACKDLLQISINVSPIARDKSSSQLFCIHCERPVRQCFKFLFFSKVAKVCKIPEARGLLLSLSDTQPLCMVFHLEGMGVLNLYLAPLIEE